MCQCIIIGWIAVKYFITILLYSRCARGYWNFTKDGCAPCNCSRTGGACDASTGNCICPPNVEGKYCDTCAPHAYGYDPTEGCKVMPFQTID